MAKYETVASLRNKKTKKLSQCKIESKLFQGEVNGANYNLWSGDVLDFLKTLKSGSIDLCFTSPPYNCSVFYDSYNDSKSWNDYEEWIKSVFLEIYRVLKRGAKTSVVVPVYVKQNEKRKALVPLFYQIMESIGFDFYDYITWVKAKTEEELRGVAGRSTAWGSYRLPSAPYCRPVSEVIVIFKKPGKFEYLREDVDIAEEEFKRFTINVWIVRQIGGFSHPATFPVELAERAVKLYTTRRQTVVDPFSGVGSTMIACLKNGRNFKGAEISSGYVGVSLQRIKKELMEDNGYSRI